MIDSSMKIRYQLFLENKFDDVVKTMSLQEKVGQVFMSFIYGKELTEPALELLKKSKLGNIIYYAWANELNDCQAVKKLSEQIQEQQKEQIGLPSIVAVDQEGGIVSRLTKDFTEFPGNMALAATGDESLARKVGIAMGKEMSAVGVNLTLGPVVDINNQPKNPVIGTRSFGDLPETVIKFAKAYIEGIKKTGILNCLKHYPGHGDTEVNSHIGTPVIEKSEKELGQLELQPFIALKEIADSIMSAHILNPKIDAKNPASLSDNFLNGILRKKIGYEGVVISDSLVMKGVVPEQKTLDQTIEGVFEAAKKAFNAGSDCLIIGRLEWADFKDATSPETSYHLTTEVLAKFKKAVEDRQIAEEKLDLSVKRILALKRKALLNAQPTDLKVVKCEEHMKLSEHVARESLTLMSSKQLFLNCPTKLSERKVSFIAPEELKEKLGEVNPSLKPRFFKNEDLKNSFDLVFNEIMNIIKDSDLNVFFSFNGHVLKEQITLLEKLSKELPEKKLVVVGLRNPQDVLIKEIIKKHLIYLTYSHNGTSIKTLLESLEDHQLPPGELPMKMFKMQDFE